MLTSHLPHYHLCQLVVYDLYKSCVNNLRPYTKGYTGCTHNVVEIFNQLRNNARRLRQLLKGLVILLLW